ncbi:hypothetical protein FDP08_02190 [Marinobacter panjinensis]|uniref:Uncharacterized protein n=1 Tax=Marinobacter panjinensis TaxID=2576384 RepID=A0A4U6R0U9_9GAMM|nr:hypothetical protein [Marinobacter panjinensis]TKV66979.1 hypothetical protein FDP08_02190 [Marinobacter panjinensis]
MTLRYLTVVIGLSASLAQADTKTEFEAVAYRSVPYGKYFYENQLIKGGPAVADSFYYLRTLAIDPVTVVADTEFRGACFIWGFVPSEGGLTPLQTSVGKEATNFSIRNQNRCMGYAWEEADRAYLVLLAQHGGQRIGQLHRFPSDLLFSVEDLQLNGNRWQLDARAVGTTLYANHETSTTFERLGLYGDLANGDSMRAIEVVDDNWLLHVYWGEGWHQRFEICIPETSDSRFKELTAGTQEMLSGINEENLKRILVPAAVSNNAGQHPLPYILCK